MLNSMDVLGKVLSALEGKRPEPARALLNLLLPQVIPFNRPLGLKIRRLTPAHSEVEIPFRRSNKNHLGGLHACALTTVGEYAAGLLILKRIDPSRQRLVLKNLNVEFLKQGRAAAIAQVEWPESAPRGIEELRGSAETQEIKLQTIVFAKDGSVELARVNTEWQIKPWSQVRTK
ncbi:MAG: DUF4442 domain-containing protein [Bdellovibrionota bacterium]